MTLPAPPAPPPDHAPAWRSRLAGWLARPRVEQALIGLILLNACILGLETYPRIVETWGAPLRLLDTLILGIFVVEIALRIAAHGLRFFRDPWSLFDFAVVAIALVPASGPFSVLRTLRVLRVLRILTLLPSMRRVVGGLISAIPGLSSVIMLMALIFYVAAVIATGLYGDDFPEWFGTLGESGYTLFQVMTLESWSMGIARPVLEAHPMAWTFFVVFILITSFTMLNLFIAVIIDATQSEANADTTRHVDDQHELTRQELRELSAEVAALRTALRSASGQRADPSPGDGAP